MKDFLPDEKEPFDAAMLAARRRLEASAEKNHPLTQKQLEAVHSAVRRQFTERQAQSVPTETRKPEPDQKQIRSLWSAIASVLRVPSFRLGYAVAVSALLLIGITFWLSRPQVIELVAIVDPDRSIDVSLPKNLRINLRSNRMELFDDHDKLSGSLRDRKELSAGITSFEFLIAGKDSEGVEARLRGTLWITNKAQVTVPRKASDISAALLKGLVETSRKTTNRVDVLFRP